MHRQRSDNIKSLNNAIKTIQMELVKSVSFLVIVKSSISPLVDITQAFAKVLPLCPKGRCNDGLVRMSVREIRGRDDQA